MKTFSAPLLLSLLVLSLGLSGASTARAGSDRFARRPHVGMTKDEAVKTYGKPDGVGDSSRGEEWTYLFNKAQFANPFAVLRGGGGGVESGSLYFRGGKVRSFQWGLINSEDRGGGGRARGRGGDERELHN